MVSTLGGVQQGGSGGSIPFSVCRDEEGLEELKEQNWELPLQDGEASGPGESLLTIKLGEGLWGTGLP